MYFHKLKTHVVLKSFCVSGISVGYLEKHDIEHLLFNSYEWPRHNFSSQYQYNFNHANDENEQKYQLGELSCSNTKFSKPISAELYCRG